MLKVSVELSNDVSTQKFSLAKFKKLCLVLLFGSQSEACDKIISFKDISCHNVTMVY